LANPLKDPTIGLAKGFRLGTAGHHGQLFEFTWFRFGCRWVRLMRSWQAALQRPTNVPWRLDFLGRSRPDAWRLPAPRGIGNEAVDRARNSAFTGL
jgi:hypothetical protein